MRVVPAVFIDNNSNNKKWSKVKEKKRKTIFWQNENGKMTKSNEMLLAIRPIYADAAMWSPGI